MKKILNNSVQKEFRQRLRGEMPKSEKLLWEHLRGRQIEGYKFRRQTSVGPYVVDFYCPIVKSVVEIDGDSHYMPRAQEYDQERDKYLSSVGLQVLRFTNTDVQQSIESVVERIQIVLKERAAGLPPPPAPPQKGGGVGKI